MCAFRQPSPMLPVPDKYPTLRIQTRSTGLKGKVFSCTLFLLLFTNPFGCESVSETQGSVWDCRGVVWES